MMWMFCGEGQLADLHRLMEEAAGILDLEAPELYVRQNPVPNAYTLAIAGRKPFVVIHTSLVELLTPAELQVFPEHPTRHLISQKKIPIPNSAKLLAQALGASLCVQSRVFGLFCRTPKSIWLHQYIDHWAKRRGFPHSQKAFTWFHSWIFFLFLFLSSRLH